MSNEKLIARLRSGDEIHDGDWSMLDEAAGALAQADKEIESLRNIVERYERIETPFDNLLTSEHRRFLFDNRFELKYLPMYADQPDPTYIVNWFWEVRDSHGSAVTQAHKWMYSAIDAAMVASAAMPEGETK